MHTPRFRRPLLRNKGVNLLTDDIRLPLLQLGRLNLSDTIVRTQSGIQTAQECAQPLRSAVGTLVGVQCPVAAHTFIATQRMHLIDAILLLTRGLEYSGGKESYGARPRCGNQIGKCADLPMFRVVCCDAIQHTEREDIHLFCMCTIELRALKAIGREYAGRRHNLLYGVLRTMKHREYRIVLLPTRTVSAHDDKIGIQPVIDDELILPLRYIAPDLRIELTICRTEIMQFLIGILRTAASDEMQQLIDIEGRVGHPPLLDLTAPHRRPPRKVAAQLCIRERVIGRKVLIDDAVIGIVVLVVRHQARLL